MQESAASKSSPRYAHVVQSLSSGPLLEGLLADLEQHSTAALALGAHGMHAPLVLDAGATAARNEVDDLYLFAGTGVLDKMPDVDDALYTGVGALEAGVMRLYGGVVIPGGWVRVVRYSHGVNLLVRLAGSRGVGDSCGAISLSGALIVT